MFCRSGCQVRCPGFQVRSQVRCPGGQVRFQVGSLGGQVGIADRDRDANAAPDRASWRDRRGRGWRTGRRDRCAGLCAATALSDCRSITGRHAPRKRGTQYLGRCGLIDALWNTGSPRCSRAMTAGGRGSCERIHRHARPCAGHPRLLQTVAPQDVDGRDEPGHDAGPSPCTTSNRSATIRRRSTLRSRGAGWTPIAQSLIRLDEARRSGDPGVGAGAGAAQCGVEGDRRGQEGQGQRPRRRR